MSLVITLVTALALLLYAQHIDAQRRELRAAKREADLRRRLDAVELALPGIEAQYGSHSHSARYLRAAKYLTSLKLRHHNPPPRRADRHRRRPMRRPVTLTALLLVALATATANAQLPRITGVAYAHASITIRFGDGHEPTYELEASVYPRAEINPFCVPGARCATGMATPLGYAYNDRVFTQNPEYHTEEITHIRQWEALGPGFLLAYVMTGGEPFEPYHTRNSVIASAAPGTPTWNKNRMWVPPVELDKAHPQLRVTWGGQSDDTTITLYPGYAELTSSFVSAIRGN